MPRHQGGFGRLVAPPDHRDQHYPMRAALAQLPTAPPRKTAYHEGALLDQGVQPQCVSFAGKGFMLAAPTMRDPGYETTEVYHACQRADEWPGENYDGTSVRALMSVLKDRGWISNYVWGQTVDDARTWMNGGYGTVIIGINWYAAMDTVDAKGFVEEPAATATPIGGHALRLNWWDAIKQGFLLVNSWGHNWGIPLGPSGILSGHAYLSAGLLTRLLGEAGEIAAPTQTTVKKV